MFYTSQENGQWTIGAIDESDLRKYPPARNKQEAIEIVRGVRVPVYNEAGQPTGYVPAEAPRPKRRPARKRRKPADGDDGPRGIKELLRF